ncbi:PEPxxWA-CTERM sorting domain-containing protein [Phenylobacterium sp.]|uniref:PEPxxWA-CTERM sorting domain-containing protein n=1 Tax=Phenylobacterium sp. TaxID=1871053 RepID=UPI0025F67236|nr:PEPxxWA-CTERM sorting domain-containing protein [Phenylobacterium sp.]MBX3482690.1 PEPxxWA-CTERM sorting domain-containing protein [Phenylobacterium sp.]MCW5760613.1 PEPxxWA-CTERM sorting domain-containing protein [Phenylobacterium sp.]
MKHHLLTAAAAAVLAAGMATGAAAEIVPIHSYHLDGSLADSYGGPSLTSYGGELGANGYAFDYHEGLGLATSAFADPAVYSVELYFQFDAVNSAYGRILNSSGNDDGLYVHSGNVSYYSDHAAYDGTAFSLGTMHHLVFARSNTSMQIYVDGALARNLNGDPASSKILNPLLFFIDEGSEDGRGYVDFIQTFDTALSAADVATLYNNGRPSPAGPSVSDSVPEPAEWALMLAGFGLAGAGLRRRTARAA